MRRTPAWLLLISTLALGANCARAPSPAPLAPRPSSSVAASSDAAASAPPAEPEHCEQLIRELCAAIQPETCEMVATQTHTFPQDRCAKMQQHVPEIIADLHKMEEAGQPLSAEAQARIAQGKAPAFGPLDAKVTVVEFSDFQCPYCAKTAPVVRQVRTTYGTRIHFVFRQYPLPMHENAHGAAEAALAAHAQGKFWELHDQLFVHQDTLTREGLDALAKSVTLDLPRFKKALDAHTYASDVDADIALGDSIHIQGTPTMFVNAVRVSNPTSFDDVSKAIEKALADAH